MRTVLILTGNFCKFANMVTAGLVKTEEGIITPDPSVSQGRYVKFGGIATPTATDHAATKGYVDSEISGQTFTQLNSRTFEPVVIDGLSAVTTGVSGRYKTVITLTDCVVGTRDDTVEDLAFGFQLGSFSSGKSYVTCVSSSIAITGEGTAHDIEHAFGSAEANEAVDTIAAITDPLASDFSNGLMETCDMTSSPTPAYKASGVILETAFLNMAAAWVADNEGDLVVNGTIVLVWDDITIP